VVSKRYLVAAALGLWLPQALVAKEPAPAAPKAAVHDNQKLADTIVENLRQSEHLKGFKIDVMVQDGVAQVAGYVASQPQKEEALRIVQGVVGVEKVRDQMTILYPQAVMPVQAAMPQQMQMAQAPMQMGQAPVQAPIVTHPFTPGVEPVAAFYGPPVSPYVLNTPYMPPYAWPTYAPYNNFSRVASPTAYPYEAWPFIGPQYPFPKVPLGWRRVELEWLDGHYWFGKTAQKHDWWRIRYW